MLSSIYLKYELNDNLNFESPSGEKLKYYSTKMNGGIIGFEPSYSSLIQLGLGIKKNNSIN